MRSTEPFWLEVSRASPNQDERPAACCFSLEFRQRRPGMRFDVLKFGSRRINGVRNFRQALASPHPAVRFTIRRGPFEEPMMKTLSRVAVAAALAAITSGCALSLGNPKIADLR